jgi:hypothetical protein
MIRRKAQRPGLEGDPNPVAILFLNKVMDGRFMMEGDSSPFQIICG